MKSSEYIFSENENAITQASDLLYEKIKNINKEYLNIIFVCIGTDRSTGDSFAPLVGTFLESKYPKNIIGTLENPVHAKNLDETINKLDKNKNLIIAIDACLGSMDSVGWIKIKDGSIKAGSGVGKDLPPVGDISIVGIVNFGGFMDFLVLQNTRLSLVYKLAKIIENAIDNTMLKLKNKNEMEKILC